MKRILACFVAVAFLGAAPFGLHAQTPDCSNTSLQGKYVFAGQGDDFSGLLCGLGICTDSTFSAAGYIVADGRGKISEVRLFAATNSGVSDSSLIGTYQITNCNAGIVSLSTADGSTKLDYDIDLGTVDSSNLAHSASLVDSDTGVLESLEVSRTVDPSGCGSGMTLENGISINGQERGTSLNGQKELAIDSMTFNNDGSTFSGAQMLSTGSGVVTNRVTG